MKLKKSYFNGYIITHEMIYFGWIGILYVLLLILSGPIATLTNKEQFYEYMVRLINFKSEIHQVTIAFIPFFMALFQFKYLHHPVQISRMHSYPYTRYEWLGSKLIAGMMILIIPQLVMALFVTLFYPSSEFLGRTLLHSPMTYMSLNIMYMLSIYFFTVMVSMISGFTIAAAFLTIVFLGLPYGIVTFIYNNLLLTLKGYYYNVAYADQITLKLSPLTLLFELPIEKINVGVVICGVVFGIVSLLLSFYFYSKRKDEMAGDFLAFNTLKPLFILSFTLCMILLGGSYLSYLYESEMGLLAGYLIGGTLGFFISQMIVQKSFAVIRKSFKNYCKVIAIIAIVFSILYFDLLGFEKRVPKLENVESVTFESFINVNEPQIFSMTYKNPESIKAIESIHKKIINEEVSSQYSKKFYLQYSLKNGTKIKRSYWIDESRYQSDFSVLYDSKEFKVQKYNVFDLDVNKISMALIESNEYWNNREKIESKEELMTLINLLKTDILEANSEALVFNRYEQAHIIFYDLSIMSNYNTSTGETGLNNSVQGIEDEMDNAIIVDLPLNSKFKRTKGWLDQIGLLDTIGLKPENVSYIVLEEVPVESETNTIISETTKTVEITEFDDIVVLLDLMSFGEYFPENEPYYVVGVGIKNKLDGMVYAYIQKSKMPEQILVKFNP